MTYSVEELIKRTSWEKCKYVFFWGHKSNVDHVTKTCFSQWYPSQFKDGDGNQYKSAEHYMMVQKAMVFGDDEAAEKIRNSKSSAQAKAYGRQVCDFDQLVWDREKFNIVVQGNFLKFSQHPELKRFLLNTKDRILVEAAPVDRVWGIGMAIDHKDIEDPTRWQGENLLGFALMKVRDSLKEG